MGFNAKTILELIEDDPKVKAWDHWNYTLYGPLSLDDHAVIEVTLINKDHSKSHFKLYLSYSHVEPQPSLQSLR